MADERLEQNKIKEVELISKASDEGGTVEDIAIASKRPEEEVVNILTPGLTEDELGVEPSDLEYTNDLDDVTQALSILPRGHSHAYLADKSRELSLIQLATNDRITPDQALEGSTSILSGSPNVLETIQAYQTIYGKNLTDQLRTFMQQEVVRDPENVALYANTTANLESSEALYDGLEGVQKILTDKFSKESPLNRSVREQEASGFAYSVFKEYAESRNVFDKLSDGIGMIIDPMSFTFDANSLITKIDPDFKGDAAEGLDKIIAGYQQLDPTLKASVFPELFDMATKAYDNNEFKIGAFVGLLHDPRFASEVFLTETLEGVELGTLAVTAPLTGAFKLAKSIQRGLSMRQALKARGNPEAAVDVTKTGRAEVDEAMDADATNWEQNLVGTNATDGLAPVYQKMADQIKEDVVSKMKAAQADDAFIKVDALSQADKDKSISSKIAELNSQDVGDTTITNARVIKQDTEGWVAQYEISRGGKAPVTRGQFIKWTVDDAGSLIAKDEAMAKSVSAALGSKVFSPEVVLRNLDDSIVADVTFGGMQSSIIRKNLADAWKSTEKGLKVNTQALDELLLAGDEADTVFKAGDLIAGNIQTLSGKRKYTMDEVQAYYAKRAFLDEAWKMQNHITKRKLEFQGYKEARWTNPSTGVEEIQIAKPFRDGRGFPTDVETTIIAPGLRGDRISITKRGAINVEDAINKGYVPVQFLKPIKIEGNLVRFGLIPGSGKGLIKDLPSKVLNQSPGYVPRISKPGYTYVKDVADGNTTVGRFKTMKGAKVWADQEMIKQAKSTVPADQRVNLQAIRDRDFSANEAMSEDASSFGGLYTGARNKDGIFTGDDLAGEVTRLSAGQSINRMVDNIANVMPLNEYRIGVVKKWKESTKQALRNQGVPSDSPIFRKIDSPDEWQTLDLSLINDVDTKNMLIAHRQYMFDSLSVPHPQENVWANFMMNIADRTSNPQMNGMLAWIASKNPAQSLKGATFDAYLGWFNPRQLYVQMQNAALAVSMYPGRAPSAIKNAFTQRMFLYTPTVDRKLLKEASNGVLDSKEVEDIALSLEQFKASGLRDSVMRSGDFDANLGGFSSGTAEGYRKLAGKGRMFFEEGESMARLISWNIARDNWKLANPGKVQDSKAIREMADDTLRMNMNMQRENAAWWQKNAFTAIPTQFLQVQAKLIENTVGGILGKGKWTRKEASMAFAGQMILYGTAGVPLASSISEAFKQSQGEGGSQIAFAQDNPKWNTAIDQGMMGTFTNLLGFQNNFSESGSIIAGLDDNVIVDLMSSVADLAMNESRDIPFTAPSLGVAQRGTDAMMTTYAAVRDMVIAPSWDTLGDSVWKSVDSIAAIASTWSNARKILYLESLGGFVNKRGNITISTENMEDVNFQSQMMRAFGMQLDIEKAYYDQKLWNFDRKKLELDTRKDLKKVYLEYRKDGNLEKFNANKAMLLAPFQDQGTKRQDVMRGFIKSITTGRSGLDREWTTWATDYIKTQGAIGDQAYQKSFISGEQE